METKKLYFTGVLTVRFTEQAKDMEVCFETYFALLLRRLLRRPKKYKKAELVGDHGEHENTTG
jgi:hypothetical protein